MKANSKFVNPKDFKSNKYAMWDLLITGVFAIIIVYAAANIGGFINGTIGNQLYDTYPATAAERSTMENDSIAGLENLSSGFTTNIRMINITAQIAIIVLPLMFVMFIKKLAT